MSFEEFIDIEAWKMKRRKTPIFFLAQNGISDLEKKAALEGIREVHSIADQTDIGIISSSSRTDFFDLARLYLHNSRANPDDDKSKLTEKQKIDRSMGNNYNYFILLDRDIFGYGSAVSSEGCFVSVHKLRVLPPASRFQAIKTISMHELGHVYHLVPTTRKHNSVETLGTHCTNQCSMRQVGSVQSIMQVTKNRILLGSPYCSDCVRDLRSYFV